MNVVNSKHAENLRPFIDLIVSLDGYRVAHCEDPAITDKRIAEGKMPNITKNIGQIWKSTKRDLYEIASLPMTLPSVARLAKMQPLLRTAQTVTLVLTFALAFAEFVVRPVPIAPTILPIILIILLISFSSTWLADRYVARRIAIAIDGFYERHPERFAKLFERLRVVVQGLLNDLNEYLARHGNEPEEFKFRLYNADYAGIDVLSEDTRSRTYLVMPTGKKKSRLH